MSFMQLQVERMAVYIVDCKDGSSELVPCDVVGQALSADDLAAYCESVPVSFERKEGWCARYSAPGYLDCTSWVGPFHSKDLAEKECRNLFGDDDDVECHACDRDANGCADSDDCKVTHTCGKDAS